MRKPHVQDALRREREVALCELASRAIGTLSEIIGDKRAPSGVRVTAALRALELAGHAPPPQGENGKPDRASKPMNQWSIEELQAELDDMKRLKAARAMPVLEGEFALLNEDPSGEAA